MNKCKENTLADKYADVLEELEWSYYEYDNKYVELSQESNAGEDFSFTVEIEDFVRDVSGYADWFDPCEHAEMWVAARDSVRGVPDVVTLVEDAKEIKESLVALAQRLSKVE